MAKKFFYVCAGILMLALSYHFGASSARAQMGGQIVGVQTWPGGQPELLVTTSDGELFYCQVGHPATHFGNIWGGSTPATTESWGAVKQRYR